MSRPLIATEPRRPGREHTDPGPSDRRSGIRLACWAFAARLLIAVAVFGSAALGYRYLLHRTGPPALWTTIVTTVAVAVVLWLLRAQVERWAHLLTYGRSAPGYQTMQSLLRRMATSLPVDEVVPQLAETMARTARSPRAEVRVELPDGKQWSQVWPSPATPRQTPLNLHIQHLGEHVGDVEIDTAGTELPAHDRRLLDGLAGPAGVALSMVRLTYALRERRDQLQSVNESLLVSQRRLIGAGVEEQQRLRAEIDDRVRPHLDAAATAIAALAHRPVQPVSSGLDEAAEQLSLALVRLRDLARGIFPPRLADAGLAVSLDSFLDQTGVAATLDLTDQTERLRAYPELEACVYFCVVTAITALARAETLSVELLVDEAQVRFVIRAVLAGAGSVSSAAENLLPVNTFLAIQDRVEAFDGSVDQPNRPRGTIELAGRIPIGPPEPGDGPVPGHDDAPGSSGR